MDIQQISQTPVWVLYEQGRNFHRRTGIYTDTDRNYRMYNGNQWAGQMLGDVEPVQKNFIKPIVKYKLSVIHDNLYAVVFTPPGGGDARTRARDQRLCGLLNRWAAGIWDRDKLDFKGRRVTKDAAINDEGILYVDFDRQRLRPVNEILKKNDVYYGNENDDDIQAQPYILIRRRLPLEDARTIAREAGLPEWKVLLLRTDSDRADRSGDAAKEELHDMVTLVCKLYREQGTIRFTLASRFLTIVEAADTGLTRYPLAHLLWEQKEGSARGEGEVRGLIPNQIEVNRTEVRRVLTVKYQAFPHKVVDVSKVANPEAISTVGGILRTNGTPVEDVRSIVGTLTPATMSPDVVRLQEDLIRLSRELAGAGDTATGAVNPENASGRAILAVQQAAQAPMTEQKLSYKTFLEDVARIWLEYLRVYAADGLTLEERIPDPATGEARLRYVKVPAGALQALEAEVGIEITPKGVYDRFAQEQTLENLLVQGFFTAQRVGELAAYAQLLEEDSVAPRQKLLEAVAHIRAQQRQVALTEARSQALIRQAGQLVAPGTPGESGELAADRGELTVDS